MCIFFTVESEKIHTFGRGVMEIYCICKCWNISYCNIACLNCLYMIGYGSKIAPPVLEVYLSLGPSDLKGTFSILSTCLMLRANMKTSWNLQRQKKADFFGQEGVYSLRYMRQHTDQLVNKLPCSCTNTGTNQQLVLFICSNICTQMAKKGEKNHRVWGRSWMYWHEQHCVA